MRQVSANRYVLFVLIVGAGVACDLASKHIVFADLGYPAVGIPFREGDHRIFDAPPQVEGQSRPYLNGWLKFRFLTSFNRGALWGVGQGWTLLFTLASVAALIGICLWLFVFSAADSRWLTVALGLIAAGTIGNLWDRLALHGYTDLQGQPVAAVRDFLLFTFGNWHYPVFNLADVFLVTGAVMLVVQSLFFPYGQRQTETAPPSASSASAVGQKSPESADSAAGKKATPEKTDPAGQLAG